MYTVIRRAAVVVALVATAGCTVKNAATPSENGPSTFATSFTVNAIPDAISQDGGSQSSVKILVIGPDGKGKSGVPLRVDMSLNGVAQDYGTLSARTIVTGSDGVASVIYTAPPSPPSGLFGLCANLPGTCIEIVATPTGTNFVTAVSQAVTIRLVPPGVILPPAGSPTASFTFSPQPATANLPIQFDASASRAGTGATQIVSYNWTFGDGSSGTGRTVTHTYSGQNTYNVTLTVVNDRTLSATSSQAVTVGAAGLPTPVFTVSPAAPAVGQPVFFNASTSLPGAGGPITSYRWTFGDGTNGAGATISHVFAAIGSYTVQLTVTDEAGLAATSTGTAVSVSAAGGGSPSSPTARFTFSPGGPATNQMIFFNASSSTPGTGHTVASYAWNFGDGPPDGTGVTPTHAFAANGTFTVTLTVTDEIGQTAVTSSTLTVSSTGGTSAPTARFTFSPSAPTTGQTIFFNASGSTVGAGHTVASYAWNFGDGTTAAGVTPTHSYAVSGSYTVTLSVTDEAAQVGVTSVPITISGVGGGTAPTATFTFGPPNPSVGEVVSFSATASTAGAGRSIASYVWTWGDGTATGSGVTATHVFTTAATFAVQVRVTDDTGQATTSAPTGVVVGAPQSPTANFTFSPASPGRNDQVVFDGSSSVQAGAGQPIVDVAWNFGDGTAVIHCVPGGAVTPECPGPTIRISAHTFVTNQTFVVNLVVTDSVGRQGTRSQSVTIALAQPNVVVSASPSSPNPGQLVSFGSGSTTFFPGSGPGPLPGSYVWSFGNGLGATGPSASTTYAAVGTYTVSLSVTDNTACGAPRCPAGTPGRTGVGTTTVTVVAVTPPTPPVASFTFGPPSPQAGVSNVLFDGRGSTGSNLTYSWNFGDGSPFGSGSTANHVYAVAGPYQVTLTVTDSVTLLSNTSAAQTVTVVP